MRFIFYSPISFEPWDWRNSVEKGIGGSETSHVEMAWRLARRGHEVITYAPIPDDCSGQWRNTTWKKLDEVDWSQDGIWVMYRCPGDISKHFTSPHLGKQVWLIMQDWDYKNDWSECYDKLDRIIVLSYAHYAWLIDKHPEIKSKVFIGSNGLKVDLIEEVESETVPARDPYKIIYASSPDRGLLQLIKIFQRAREIIPSLTLHVFYGFNNLDKLADSKSSWASKFKRDIEPYLHTPGIYWRGRVSQNELYKEWLSASLWCYPSNFWETSCITCMEAQAMGAIPILIPTWAQGENTHYGIGVEGDAADKLTQARFAGEIVRLISNPELQDKIRSSMMPWARDRFDWENFVSQWELWADGVDTKFHCRSCHSSDLQDILDLGVQHFAGIFPRPQDEVGKAPLKVMTCNKCKLVQLRHTVDRKKLFTDYMYQSGINKTMREHLKGLAESLHVEQGDVVVDIGANDGTFLSYVDDKVKKVGFEPSKLCQSDCINSFFSKDLYKENTKAKYVMSLAMFYDLDDPVAFARDVKSILHPDGTWIIELQDFETLAKTGAFDTVCHEHLMYFTISTLSEVLHRAGFYVDSYERNSINGGSLRVYAKVGGPRPVEPSTVNVHEWASKVTSSVLHLISVVRSFVAGGKTIWGYGASTKGNVILQACRFDSSVIQFIADKNPAKYGCVTPGTNIPIVSESDMRQAHPDYLLMLPWGFQNEFIENEEWADWIIPFPELVITSRKYHAIR